METSEIDYLKTQNESLLDQVHVLQEVLKIYQEQLVLVIRNQAFEEVTASKKEVE